MNDFTEKQLTKFRPVYAVKENRIKILSRPSLICPRCILRTATAARGDESHCIPLAKMLRGMHPPAVDAPAGGNGSDRIYPRVRVDPQSSTRYRHRPTVNEENVALKLGQSDAAFVDTHLADAFVFCFSTEINKIKIREQK